MSPNDSQDDRLFAALRELGSCDVSPAYAQDLRSRCHRGLQASDLPTHVPRSNVESVWRVLGMLAGAWCVLYLLETMRQAAAVYGF
jgi:hypothetical protein